MLRNEDDELVMLGTELHFVGSYYYLLKTRYGEGLRISINVNQADLDQWLPPLTLQIIIENAFTQNVMKKDQPLHIHIDSASGGIVIRNNVQPKLIDKDKDIESGIDNLVTRYKYLHQAQIVIADNEKERVIQLPLFGSKEGRL
jgi:LytS/YehU family sensor histidine kinase